jgi:hypothetical protein
VNGVIPVDELWPGEVVVTSERVALVRARLERGGVIDPVSVVKIGSRMIVRDGNKRSRPITSSGTRRARHSGSFGTTRR